MRGKGVMAKGLQGLRVDLNLAGHDKKSISGEYLLKSITRFLLFILIIEYYSIIQPIVFFKKNAWQIILHGIKVNEIQFFFLSLYVQEKP